MSINNFFGEYQSQTTRQLAQISSSRYPDTNKDFEANVRRLNAFVDYIAQYLGTMQKGIDQANADVTKRIRDMAGDLVVLLGGGELLYGIDLGDLQYFLPALGALFGLDSDTPFPLNLFEMAQRFLLGYVVPLDAFGFAVQDIIIGWAEAFGLDPEFIDALNDVMTELIELGTSLLDILENLWDLLEILGISTDGFGPFADLWHVVTQLLGSFGLEELGDLTDPVFEALAPWVKQLAQLLSNVNAIIDAFSGGLTDLQGVLNFASFWTGIIDFADPAFNSTTALSNWFAALLDNGVLGNTGKLFTSWIPDLDVSKILNLESMLTGFIPFSFFDDLTGIPGSDADDVFDWFGQFLNADFFENIIGTNEINVISSWFRDLATGPIAPNRLNGLSLSSLIDFTPNPLINGGFDTAISLIDNVNFVWDGTLGHSTPFGTARTTGDGTTKVLLSNYVQVFPNQQYEFEVWCKHVGAVASGIGCTFGVIPYETKGVDLAQPTEGRMEYTPSGNSNNPGESNFVLFNGGYTVPATGVNWIRLEIRVRNTVSAGTFWFDDAAMEGIQTQIPWERIAGIQGLTNMGDTVQSIIDTAWSAIKGSLGSGKTLAQLGSAFQEQSVAQGAALSLAIDATNVLSQRDNRRVGEGIDANAQGAFDLTDCDQGATPSYTTVTASSFAGVFIRIDRDDVKQSVTWFGAGSASITAYYINIYKLDLALEQANKVYTSADLKGQLSSGWNWNVHAMPSSLDVKNGETYLIEHVLAGAGSHNLASKNLDWMVSHPTAVPRRPATARPGGTLSPSSIVAGSLGYSSKIPWAAFGGLATPTEYHPPLLTPFEAKGTFTYNIPAWAQFVDVVMVGGGGGGESSQWNRGGYGGEGGKWYGITLERGVHFHSAATTFTISVGSGGDGNVTWYALGQNGNPTTCTYPLPGGGTATVTAQYGRGGNRDGNPNAIKDGLSPGNFSFNGSLYVGGSQVGAQAAGDAPGGGAGGAVYASVGFSAGNGGAWLTAR